MEVSVGYSTSAAARGMMEATREKNISVLAEVICVLGVVSQALANKLAVLDRVQVFADSDRPDEVDRDRLQGVDISRSATIVDIMWPPGASSGREVTVGILRRSGRRFAILLQNPNTPTTEALLVDAEVCEELTGWSINSTQLIAIELG